jgi:hypothetical protein
VDNSPLSRALEANMPGSQVWQIYGPYNTLTSWCLTWLFDDRRLLEWEFALQRFELTWSDWLLDSPLVPDCTDYKSAGLPGAPCQARTRVTE